MIRTAYTSAVALATVISTASADTITVCANGCEYTSINAAIAAASDGDVIQLAAEAYFEGEQIDTLGKAITLRGVVDKNGLATSILDGADSHRVLICQTGESKSTILEDLLVRNGLAVTGGSESYSGAGLACLATASPTLRNCVFTDNHAIAGGALYAQSGPLRANGCFFIGNSAIMKAGGAILAEHAILIDCEFQDNVSPQSGGAIFASTAELTGCSFAENFAFNGGGVSSHLSLTMIDCAFDSNEAWADGGGVHARGECTIESSVFASNTAVIGGGAFLENGNAILAGCFFEDNSASFGGGGVFSNGDASISGSGFVNNFAEIGGGVFVSGGDALITMCEFSRNQAAFGGGMKLLVDDDAEITAVGCILDQNMAFFDGGGLVAGGAPRLEGCTFLANWADNVGGAVFSEDGSAAHFDLCVFTRNQAAIAGHGLWNEASSSPRMSSCVFSECCQVDPPRSAIDLGRNEYESWCEECRADLDCRNGTVDASDLGYMLARWGTSDPQSDINGDEIVDSGDLGLLIAAWGPCS